MCGNPPEKTAWGSRVPRLRAHEASYKRIRVLLSTVIKRDHTASVIMWVRGCPPSVPWRQRERRTYVLRYSHLRKPNGAHRPPSCACAVLLASCIMEKTPRDQVTRARRVRLPRRANAPPNRSVLPRSSAGTNRTMLAQQGASGHTAARGSPRAGTGRHELCGPIQRAAALADRWRAGEHEHAARCSLAAGRRNERTVAAAAPGLGRAAPRPRDGDGHGAVDQPLCCFGGHEA